MTGPMRTDCVREGCGHSSDVHVLRAGQIAALVTVTVSAGCWPCEECDCPTMVRSIENYAALIGDVE